MSVFAETIAAVKNDIPNVRQAVALYVVLTQAEIGGRKLTGDELTIMGYLSSIFDQLKGVWR